MERYMVTHSLLSSWMYALQENPYEDATTEKDPMTDFMLVLNRKPTPTTEAMQKGIRFEDLVTAIVNGQYKPPVKFGPINPVSGDVTEYRQYDPWYAAAEQVASIVKGGILQYSVKREVALGDRKILLYGRLDALKAGVIYDIKFSGSYEAGKYLGSTQHPMYLTLVPEARQFTYLVSNGSQVWTETYRRDEAPDIMQTIYYFYAWLDTQGLDGVYREHWLAR